jgi:hypothetical protein
MIRYITQFTDLDFTYLNQRDNGCIYRVDKLNQNDLTDQSRYDNPEELRLTFRGEIIPFKLELIR